MQPRAVRHPRLNWLARWIGAAVFTVFAIDFVAADWIGYYAGPGVACPLIYSVGGRRVTAGWFSEFRTNPKNSWFKSQYIHMLSPSERQYWKWSWWPEGSLGRAPNELPSIMVPTWMIVLASGTLSGLAWRAWWKDRHTRRGGCAACGYSREGLPANTACPECGLAPKP